MMFDDGCGLTMLTLKGVKTRTSRIVPRLPESFIRPIGLIMTGPHKGWFEYLYGAGAHGMFKPPYQIGEKIAVAQSYRTLLESEYLPTKIENQVIAMVEQDHKGVGNKMYVRADLMAHYITVTGLRMERLQYISDEDIMREGVVKSMIGCKNLETGAEGDFAFLTVSRKNGKTTTTYNVRTTAREAFSGLIDKVCGKGVWEWNPWIWAVDYKLVRE